MTPDETRFFAKTVKDGSCLRWTAGKFSDGYGGFYLNGKSYKAHRIAWQFANGPIPDGLYCCHTCDNRWCVEPAHLWLGTQLDNVRDMVSKGRCNNTRPGLENGNAKLTNNDVRAIRKASAGGETYASIARRYPVCNTTIRYIVKRYRWPHIK